MRRQTIIEVVPRTRTQGIEMTVEKGEADEWRKISPLVKARARNAKTVRRMKPAKRPFSQDSDDGVACLLSTLHRRERLGARPIRGNFAAFRFAGCLSLGEEFSIPWLRMFVPPD
jgi:hypothetical protein